MAIDRGLHALLEAKPGKGDELAAFLAQGRALAAEESGTVTWYAFRLSDTTYGECPHRRLVRGPREPRPRQHDPPVPRRPALTTRLSPEVRSPHQSVAGPSHVQCGSGNPAGTSSGVSGCEAISAVPQRK